jgi:Plasmid pRiA4b ORF-3-like protein
MGWSRTPGRAPLHQQARRIVALEMATKLGQTDGMTASPTDAIATLRIEIKYIEPLIWRRVAVRTSMNLKALHTVIQATVGWLDYHLWEFVIDERKYGIPDPDRPHVKNGATTQLAAILASGMTEFGYVYDFVTTGNIGSPTPTEQGDQSP